MSTTLSQRKPGTLSSNVVDNLKNDGHVLAITRRSGITTMNPPLPAAKGLNYHEVIVDETPIVESKKATSDHGKAGKDKGEGVVVDQERRQIPRPPPSFPL